MLLKEINHHPALASNGSCVFRDAVRGIIYQDGAFLMIFSEINGDYKFPGGGVKPGETHPIALARELQEECGATLTNWYAAFACITEIDQAIEDEIELFKMKSTYYPCRIASELGSLRLDQYEEELGFRPRWVSLEEAIQTNRVIVQRPSPPRWTIRDLFILEALKNLCQSGMTNLFKVSLQGSEAL